MIAIVSTTQGPGHGAEVVLAELLHAWHDVRLPLTVVAPKGSGPATAASALGVPWVPLQASRDALLTNLIAGHRAVPSLRSCRLVHAWSARGLELSWWIGRRLGAAITATAHDHPDTATQTWLRRRLWRVTANLQDALAFPSAALEMVWRAAGFRRPSRVVPNGSSELHVARRDSNREAVVIGFLGMYAPWKGFEIARSWARAGWPAQVRWVFFGETSAGLTAAVTELVAAMGPQVRFAGAQPREQIFGEIDVLVHCSTAFDPFPTVLLEAAERGIPVVASSLGGAGEIVVHDETGFLFDPVGAEGGLAYLIRLVGDSSLRARLGAAARTRFERLFRAERMAEGYAALWRDVLSGVLRTPR